MKTVLLTLGRLPKALDLARGFAGAGCRVLVAEPFRRHLAGASRHVTRSIQVPAPSEGKAAYLAALDGVIRNEGVDLVVPVSEETMHVAFLRDRLAGRGVRMLPRGAALPVPDPADPAVVQAFIPGRVHSSCSIAHEGRVLATVIYRGTVMQGTVAVAFERVAEQPAITAWIETFVAAVGWSGFISFDFVVDAAGQAHGIECNPRATSGVHFWQPVDVAGAILHPDRFGGPAGATVRVRPEGELQQFYSCLTETQMAVFRRDGALARLRRLATTRDVTWDWRDPMPFLTMPVTSWRIIAMSIARRTTFGEVATLDVGWYEGGRLAGA